jgi:hypothetical protein
MTEPIDRISGARETGRKNVPDLRVKQEKHPRHMDENEEDCIDISEEAREKAAGEK